MNVVYNDCGLQYNVAWLMCGIHVCGLHFTLFLTFLLLQYNGCGLKGWLVKLLFPKLVF